MEFGQFAYIKTYIRCFIINRENYNNFNSPYRVIFISYEVWWEPTNTSCMTAKSLLQNNGNIER